jgi:hypothetical protein
VRKSFPKVLGHTVFLVEVGRDLKTGRSESAHALALGTDTYLVLCIYVDITACE